MTSQDLGAITGNAVVAHVYANAGTFSIVATLTDSFGNIITARTAVSVVTAATPTVIVTAPSVPNPLNLPFTANFTIQVTPPTGIGITNVSVCWGDTTPCVPQNLGGLTGTQTVQHQYQVGHQTFTVTATATDTLNRQTPGTTTITLP